MISLWDYLACLQLTDNRKRWCFVMHAFSCDCCHQIVSLIFICNNTKTGEVLKYYFVAGCVVCGLVMSVRFDIDHITEMVCCSW